MQLIVCRDYNEMSRRAAGLAAESIREKPSALVSFPGGETPVGMVSLFVDMVNRGELDISGTRFVSLDEWVGLSGTDEGSCRLFLHEKLLGRLRRPFADVHIIDGAAEDLGSECAALDDYIARYGPLTLSVLGIGLNGHLGFNEDGVDFTLNAHITPLSETTKNVMHKYFGEKFHPAFGITQGLAQIMRAEKVVLIASGAHKAGILRKALCGEVSESVPASLLQRHPNCFAVVDEAAAALL